MSDDDGEIIRFGSAQLPELPIKTVTTTLTQTEGRGLKQNTRANPALIDAVMFGYPWVQRWKDGYVENMLNDMMCLAISVDGQGRRDQIDALNACGAIPEAYYTGGRDQTSRNGDTAYMR